MTLADVKLKTGKSDVSETVLKDESEIRFFIAEPLSLILSLIS